METVASPAPQKRGRLISLICGSAPLILLLLLLSLAAHIRLALGRWPTPMVDDHHSAIFRMHDDAIGAWAIFSVYGALPVWFFCQVFPRWRATRHEALTCFAMFFAGWILIFIAARFDPTTFTEWFLD